MNRIVEEDDVPKEIRDFNEYIYDFLKRRYHGSVKKTEEVRKRILTFFLLRNESKLVVGWEAA